MRIDLAEVVKSEQGVTGARGGWQKKALIVGQIAVSAALFGTAVLFLASLRNATAVRPGKSGRQLATCRSPECLKVVRALRNLLRCTLAAARARVGLGPWGGSDERDRPGQSHRQRSYAQSFDLPRDTKLIYVLRNDLGLNGPKFGCGLGECGACTVLIDGMAARSCVVTLKTAEGRSITTLEGSADCRVAPGAGGVHRRAGGAMRLLPQRHDHDRRGATRA